MKILIMPAGDFPSHQHPQVEATIARLAELRPDGWAVQATMRNSVEPEWFLRGTPWDWYERVAHIGALSLLRMRQIEAAGGNVDRIITDYEVRGNSWSQEHYLQRIDAIERVSRAVMAATEMAPCGHYGLNNDPQWRWTPWAIGVALETMKWSAWCASAYFRRGVETDVRWEIRAARNRGIKPVIYLAGVDAELQDSEGRHAVVPPAKIAEQVSGHAAIGVDEWILWLDLNDPRSVEIAAGVLAEVRGPAMGGG